MVNAALQSSNPSSQETQTSFLSQAESSLEGILEDKILKEKLNWNPLNFFILLEPPNPCPMYKPHVKRHGEPLITSADGKRPPVAIYRSEQSSACWLKLSLFVIAAYCNQQIAVLALPLNSKTWSLHLLTAVSCGSWHRHLMFLLHKLF